MELVLSCNPLAGIVEEVNVFRRKRHMNIPPFASLGFSPHFNYQGLAICQPHMGVTRFTQAFNDVDLARKTFKGLAFGRQAAMFRPAADMDVVAGLDARGQSHRCCDARTEVNRVFLYNSRCQNIHGR